MSKKSDHEELNRPEGSKWYVLEGNQTLGPYPPRLISRYLIMGRVSLDSKVSTDRKNWQSLKKVRSLIPEEILSVQSEADMRKLMHARMREDERSGGDRRQDGTAEYSQDSRKSDRRTSEDNAMKMHRKLRGEAYEKLLLKTRGDKKGYIVLMVIAMAIVAGFFIIEPAEYGDESDCTGQPEAGINWSRCNKQGLDLGGLDLRSAQLTGTNLDNTDLSNTSLKAADMSYASLYSANLFQADLSLTKLVGANFRNANLESCNMAGANLSYANLGGASIDNMNLRGALLDHAIWIDGQTCRKGSIGKCLR